MLFIHLQYLLYNVLTYSPRLKQGDSGINKGRTSHDGLTSSTPIDNAMPM